MLEDFSFTWNGKKWYGYINALSSRKIYVHFEDHELRDLFKGSLKMRKKRPQHFTCKKDLSIYAQYPLLYEGILKAVAKRMRSKLELS